MVNQPRNRVFAFLLTACAALGRADAEEKKDAPEADAAGLVSALNWNDALADEKLIGKRIRVKGYAKQVQRTKQGYTLTLSSDQAGTVKEPLALQFEFAPDDRQALAELPHRRLVTVEAFCHGKFSPDVVRFSDSKIISVQNATEKTTTIDSRKK